MNRTHNRPPKAQSLELPIAAGVVIWVVIYLSGPELTNFNISFNQGLNPYRSEMLVSLLGLITKFGSFIPLLSILALASALIKLIEPHRSIAPLWWAFAGERSITWGAKYFFDHPRPEFTTSFTASSPSFPSSHSAGIMLVYGILGCVMSGYAKNQGQRFLIFGLSLTVITLVGFSRLLLGVHYVTDVLAGICIGAFWAYFACWFYKNPFPGP